MAPSKDGFLQQRMDVAEQGFVVASIVRAEINQALEQQAGISSIKPWEEGSRCWSSR